MTASASNQQGLDLLRMSTAMFIADDPTTINLISSKGVKTAKPGGGFDYADGSPRGDQDFKVIAQGDTDGLQDVDGGKVRSISYTLIGAWDADIRIDDRWTDGSNWYRVVGITPANGYEVKATAIGLGPEPNYG